MAEVVPRLDSKKLLVVGERLLLRLAHKCTGRADAVGDVYAPDSSLCVAIIADPVIAAVGGRDERAVVPAKVPEVIRRRGDGAVGVIEFPTHARAHADPH